MQAKQLKHLQWSGLKTAFLYCCNCLRDYVLSIPPAPYQLALEQNNYWRTQAQQDEAKPDISILLKLSEKVGVVPAILK